jgi:diguanylate cyclase (GGDEF)-like protein
MLSTFIGGFMPVSAKTNQVDPYRILCILSYNYSYEIVSDEMDGIEAGLSSDDYKLDYEITYESMDSKKFYTAEDIVNFEDYLTYKLSKQEPYDLIITADDSALRFAINHRDTIFKDIPIVFMGVNSIADAQTAAVLDGVTGVAEVPDYEANYELMKSLFPERTTIVAIVDGTNTGQGEFVQFREFIANHPEQDYRVLNTSRYSREGIEQYLSELGDTDIILYLDFLEDGEENIYALDTATKFIATYAEDIPIFRVSSADIGNGVLGGVSYSFYNAGKIAGHMGARILSETDTSEIELVTDTVTNTFFDQKMMDKFDIKILDIPEDAIILNERTTIISWYRENTVIANLSILVCVLLLIIITLLAIANGRREVLVNRDTLTGIPNRLNVNRQIKATTVQNESYGLIMVDLDYFKNINDNLGHLGGDEVLIELANRLEAVAKENNSIAARIGGDEFVVFKRNAKTEDCKHICEQLQIMMQTPISTSQGEVSITLSMGTAIYPEDTDNPSKVMSLADKALYSTKKNGRNGYTLYKDIKK